MEILSPASNLEHIKVAIDHKANAVYGGLKNWNARNKAINFTTDEYNYLIDELHKNNIKFFLTLNILMLDDEIEEVIKFLKNNKLPDSFIVADLGLIRRLHREFPNVPLHFSTQFGCHNIDDVNYVKSLGGERAILARELTLEELNKISDNTDIELECFIWGSQCLSFSGLCFFGTLINGGGGNRGKCMITCRDLYSINGDLGHYLYVPDMDCINLKSKLTNIDCLKIEGRRRNPIEIAKILDTINNNIKSKRETGYLYGLDIDKNKLYEKINKRIKPVMKAKELLDISPNDICIEYLYDIPIRFSNEYDNDNVMYVYTEVKKNYLINKKNLMIDFVLKDNFICEALLVNNRGNGHTFYGDSNNLIKLDIDSFINDIEKENSNINIYKIKYKRGKTSDLFISSDLLFEMKDYILKDCAVNKLNRIKNDLKINELLLETADLSVINNFINEDKIRIIYDIATINNLKKIESVINIYGDRIIYKLPLFNWNSEELLEYYKLLEGKDVMFTRFTQIYLTKDIKFRKKYTDYTIYIWNSETLKYLKENGIEEFTASPELSFSTNSSLFKNENVQFILGGKMPMVYTRNCFKNIYKCKNCMENKGKVKKIYNEDKNLDFEILCTDDYRYILNKTPILNDYTTLPVSGNVSFRYCSSNHTIDQIKEVVEAINKDDYYEYLKNKDYWLNSYECNLEEGKD